VNIRPEPYVVSEIPRDVVGILIKDNLIAVPKPVIAVVKVVGSDGEVIAAEPEAFTISPGQDVKVFAAETAGESPMLPFTVDVIVEVVAPGTVADPLIVSVHVGNFGMPRLVGKTTLLGYRGLRRPDVGRAVRGNESVTMFGFVLFGATALLGRGDGGQERADPKCSNEHFHVEASRVALGQKMA